MPQAALFSATLGLVNPWRITSVSLDAEKRLNVIIDFHSGKVRCHRCGNELVPCSVATEVWFHADFLRYTTLLHAQVPRIDCCCGITPVERPWSRPGSKFILLN